MRIHTRLVLVPALALLCATANAQLKAPGSASQGLQPALQAAPAAAPSAPDAPAADKETAAKESAGTAAATAWLQQLDKRDWRNAWQASSQKFRTTVPVAAWMEGIPKAREPLGALAERSAGQAAYRTTLEGQPDGEYVSVVYLSKFANKPDTEELVTTVREADGKWRVMGYQTR